MENNYFPVYRQIDTTYGEALIIGGGGRNKKTRLSVGYTGNRGMVEINQSAVKVGDITFCRIPI